MTNLICFPHYTCGGLLCDIFNHSHSPVSNLGAILSMQHSIGKIGDTNTVQIDYDSKDFVSRVEKWLKTSTWIGTHLRPKSDILQLFDQVILVTTATHRSRIYRWARVYNHYFSPTWKHLTGQELIDKARETAKNYLVPFEPVQASNVVNVEFADIVDTTPEFWRLCHGYDTAQLNMQRWQKINNFLFNVDLWNSFEIKIFYQAEFEQQLGRYYIYN